MKKLCILIFFITVPLQGQQDSYLSLIQYQMPLINPAYAGAEEDQLFSIHSRNQWANIENSPGPCQWFTLLLKKEGWSRNFCYSGRIIH